MRKGIRIIKLLVRTLLVFVLFSVALVTLLRWVPVRHTPVMLKRAFQFRDREGFRTEQEWVSLENVSPELIKAVIASEDTRFFFHHGFDFKALRTMWKDHRTEGSRLRGCSTISQQTAKNVFTLGTRSPLRKISEAWWTFLIELMWGKRRILEVYLNVIEWGAGLYGAEIASLEYFGIPAANLHAEQATAMAVCLPKPLLARPDHLSPEMKRHSSRILQRMPSVQIAF